MFRNYKEEVTLKGYTNSDIVGNRDDRRLTSSYFYTLHGTIISWKSQFQKVVALSFIEAKYIVVTDAKRRNLINVVY